MLNKQEKRDIKIVILLVLCLLFLMFIMIMTAPSVIDEPLGYEWEAETSGAQWKEDL